MQVTPNYGLKKIELTDSPPDITVHSGNFDIIDAQLKINSNEINILKELVVASGTNAYSATIPNLALVEGVDFKIKFVNASTSNPTLNVNGLGAKSIKKASGSPATIKANSYLKLIYSGTDFILLGEGGEYGTAQVQQVLSGYTIGTDDGLANGTMPNRGSVGTRSLSTQNGQYVIPEGYHDGTGIVKAYFYSLFASNIKEGVDIGGVIGNLKPGLMAVGSISVSTQSYNPADYITGSVNAAAWNNKATVTNISFKPDIVIIYKVSPTSSSNLISITISKTLIDNGIGQDLILWMNIDSNGQYIRSYRPSSNFQGLLNNGFDTIAPNSGSMKYLAMKVGT